MLQPAPTSPFDQLRSRAVSIWCCSRVLSLLILSSNPVAAGDDRRHEVTNANVETDKEEPTLRRGVRARSQQWADNVIRIAVSATRRSVTPTSRDSKATGLRYECRLE